MDNGKNKNSRFAADAAATHDGSLFPKNRETKIANRPAANARPAWIADATEHRSARAQESFREAHVLQNAKQIDPRHTVPDTRLLKIPIEQPNPRAYKKHRWLRDTIGLAVFIGAVIIGSFLINTFIFRSYDVIGPSMYPTLDGNNGQYTTAGAGSTSDRLIVNETPVTIAHMLGKTYTPQRGQIVVFANPEWVSGPDEWVVKRVIGLPGDRITVNDCTLLVHNAANPAGFNPYKSGGLFDSVANKNDCVAGDGTNETVPAGSIFVVGDHRDDTGMQWSMDSRNGDGRPTLGLIPLKNIIGPVAIRIWPLNKIKFI